MANTLQPSGIITGQTVEATHVKQNIDAFTGAENYDIKISGSLTVTGSLLISGSTKFDIPSDSGNSGFDTVVLDPTTGTLYTTGSYGVGAGGAQGAVGPQGAEGSQGTTGEGTQGPTGTGSQGAEGSQGPIGVGSQGPTGDEGAQGPTGDEGAQGTTGNSITGPQGPEGAQGVTSSGPQGPTGEGSQGPEGAQGPEGSQGTTGEGTQGPTGEGSQGPTGADSTVQGPEGAQGTTGNSIVGPQGPDGSQGPTGNEGSQGPTGADSTVQGPEGGQGTTGAQGPEGAQGTTGEGSQGPTGADSTVQGPQGAQGLTGADSTAQGPEGSQGTTGDEGAQGPTGPEGSGGGTGNVYNTQYRYLVNSSGTDYELYATSTTNLYVVSWARTTTTMVVTYNGHGLGIGDKVVLRGANIDYQIADITAITTNTFTFTCTDTGGTSGDEAVYGSLFTGAVTQTGGDISAISISAPGGLNGSSQLNNLTFYANNQESNLVLTLPSGLQEGAGGFNDKQSINIIDVIGKGADGSGTSTAITPATSFQMGSNFNQVTISGIDNFTPVLVTIRF